MKKVVKTPDSSSGRREFIRNIIYSTFSIPLASACQVLRIKEHGYSFKKGQMLYRRLGRTNLLISEISLGGSPLPPKPVLYQAIERGVNYIDTSHGYMNGNSERQIGELFSDLGRDKIYVGTKFHIRSRNLNEKLIIDTVNGSLQRLKSDYMDVLLIHGARDEKHLTDERVLNAFEMLKKQGKYRFRGLSCHSNHHRVVKKAVECGYYDVINLAYNVYDVQDTKKDYVIHDDYLGKSGLRRLISLAKANDVGIIAMKTLKTGIKKQNLTKYRTESNSIYQAMIKWALENKNITSVLTEMLTFKQLEEDLAVLGNPLTRNEKRNLFRFVAKNSRDYCHMCNSCDQNCPSNIKTTSILRFLAYHENYGKTNLAKQAYSQLKPEQTVSACQNCGECERVCPYGVSIRKQIKRAHLLLS